MRTLTLSLSLFLAAEASAGDTGLSISTSSKVLVGGETAQVSVHASFPVTGYAFAHATLDVAAGIPCWNLVSAGVIAGPTVQGIDVGQTHNPFSGVFADPSNPIKIWSGYYTAKTNTPLLVPITATPSAFSYYPSALTTSTVPAEAGRGRAWLFVNPVFIDGVAIAPGEGTSVRVYGGGGDDVLIGGTTGFNPFVIGMLVPAVQKVRIAPSLPPTSLTLETHYDQQVPPSALSFTATVTPATYDVQADWPIADEYEYGFEYQGQTIRLRIAAVNNRGMSINHLPLTYGMVPSRDPVNLDDLSTFRLRFGSTTPIVDPEGHPRLVDAIEIAAIRHNSPGALTPSVQTVEIRGGAHGSGGGGGAGKVSMRDFSF